MKRLLVLLAACNAPPEHKLPSSSVTPRLERRPPTQACGIDIASGDYAVHYRYSYDDLGRLAHADGTYDSIDYSYDNLDHMVHSLQVGGGVTNEAIARYTTLGDLVEYTLTQTAPSYRDDRRYAFSAFTDTGLPTRELVAASGSEASYQLAYDASGRLTVATPEGGGDATIYTYDDDARTTTIDSGNGALHGVIVYDDANHEISETWGGTDPQVTPSEDRYDWDGDRLLRVTRRVADTVEIDTYRYDCPQ